MDREWVSSIYTIYTHYTHWIHDAHDTHDIHTIQTIHTTHRFTRYTRYTLSRAFIDILVPAFTPLPLSLEMKVCEYNIELFFLIQVMLHWSHTSPTSYTILYYTNTDTQYTQHYLQKQIQYKTPQQGILPRLLVSSGATITIKVTAEQGHQVRNIMLCNVM